MNELVWFTTTISDAIKLIKNKERVQIQGALDDGKRERAGIEKGVVEGRINEDGG